MKHIFIQSYLPEIQWFILPPLLFMPSIYIISILLRSNNVWSVLGGVLSFFREATSSTPPKLLVGGSCELSFTPPNELVGVS